MTEKNIGKYCKLNGYIYEIQGYSQNFDQYLLRAIGKICNGSLYFGWHPANKVQDIQETCHFDFTTKGN